jgi:acyl-CoA synthetase (AMP-forming)/AMP-acid ligase II
MMVSGGEDVYPIEVENAPAIHSAVEDTSVVGVADEQFGQRPAAFVVLKPGVSATADVLKQHLRAHLANYKVPRKSLSLDELPRNAVGRI